jgi:release factor glutamine methyltransferase
MRSVINFITTQTDLTEQQAWWLLEHTTNKNRSQLQFSYEKLTELQQTDLEKYMHQLSYEHKPLAYILGWVPFLDLELNVSPPTLIPRPETEFWVFNLIEELKNKSPKNLTILDIGTGSGCIALSLAKALPQSQIYAIDIAQTALDLAQKNAERNNITNVTFLHSNLFADLPNNLQFDLIVSNPPYIDPAVTLEKNVRNWEDHGALFAPNQGLQIIESIIAQAPTYIKKNNELDYQLVMEIDASQANQIHELAAKHTCTDALIKQDQFDRDRTAWIKF